MKFDDFLRTINDFGRYQILRYFCICLTYMLPSLMVYTWLFAAATPSFRCKLYENDSIFDNQFSIISNRSQPDEEYCKANMKISVKECQRCYMKTISKMGQVQIQPCEGYVFDRTYYQYTLVEEWLMVCDRTGFRSLVQLLFFVGYMVGSILFGIMGDKYGRRPIMSICIILMVCTGFICALFPQKKLFGFWPSYLVYTISRSILACSTQGIAVTGFVLATELVGPKNKILTAIIIEYFVIFGQLFLTGIAYFISEWRHLTLTISLFTLPFTLFYFVLPESARWMITKGHYQQAETLLRKMAKTNKRTFDEEAFQHLENEQEKNTTDKPQKVGVLALFHSKIMCIIFINLFFQWFVQNLAFYGISKSTDFLDFVPFSSMTISVCVRILSSIVLYLVLNRIGRRRSYFIAVVCFSIITLLTIPVQRFMLKNSEEQEIVIFIMNILLKFFAVSSYTTIYIYSNELFPTGIRNTGMGICSMVARIGAIVGTMSNDSLTRIWINLLTVLCGILSLIAAFLILMLPETLNKPLPQTIEDIEQMGLRCIRIGGAQRTSKRKGEPTNQIDLDSNEDQLLNERLRAVEDS